MATLDAIFPALAQCHQIIRFQLKFRRERKRHDVMCDEVVSTLTDGTHLPLQEVVANSPPL